MLPEPTGVIYDIDHFAAHDGPGIRAVVYLKGCPLRCVWCHSPESQNFFPEPVFIKSKCVKCEKCEAESDAAKCARGARLICGKTATVSEVIAEILPDKMFFDSSGGGVTLSGGEALSQPDFTEALLKNLRENKIHTIVETGLYADFKIVERLSSSADVFYCDIKTIDSVKHKKHTGHGNEIILSNLKLLARKKNNGVVIRAPLIPGYNDSDDDVRAVYDFASENKIPEIHLLKYNPSAPAKYEWLAREYKPGVIEPRPSGFYEGLAALAPAGLKIIIV